MDEAERIRREDRRQAEAAHEDRRRQDLLQAIDWALIVGKQRDRIAEHEELLAASARDRIQRAASGVFQAHTHKDRQSFVEARADRCFMVMAASQLMKALTRLETHGVPSEVSSSLAYEVRILRNCLEHWEDREGWSHQAFAKRHPNGDPKSFRFGAGGTYAGELDLDELAKVAGIVYRKLLELEQTNFVWEGSL